jgi:hypothetical protein
VLRQITKSHKDFGDPVIVADITKKFAALERDLTLPCAQRLDKLTAQSVNLVHPHHRRPARHRICRDWSPDSVALEIHLKRAYALERLSKQGKTYNPWRYARILRDSAAALNRVAKSPEQLEVFESLTEYNTAYWTGLPWPHAQAMIPTALSELKQLLTSDLKKYRRKQFLTSIKKRNYELQLGKLRNVILRVLGSKKKNFKLEALKIGEDSVIAPGAIHAIVQQYLTKWFSNPSDDQTPPDWENILHRRHQRNSASSKAWY